MFSPVASGIFVCRNVDKVENGEVGRVPVALGQITGLIKEIGKYDKAIALGTKSAVSIFQDITGNKESVKIVGKAFEFLSNNVNPLICASSVLKVAMSEDKEKTLKEEIGSIGLMFAGETLISKNYDKVANSKTVKTTLDKISKTKLFKPIFNAISKHNWGGKVGAIIKGLTFATGSIGSSYIGLQLAKSIFKTNDINGKECIVS